MMLRRTVMMQTAACVPGVGGVLAQTVPGRIPRVAILSPGSTEARPVFAAFRAGLQALGYVEGRNIGLDFHFANGSGERLSALAQAIVGNAPDIVLADGGVAANVLQSITRSIPIVAIGSIDPDTRNLAASHARPGGNVTGISTFSAELPVKQIELLHEMAPAARMIGALGTQTERSRLALAEAAASLGVGLRLLHVAASADVERVLSPEALANIGAILVTQNPVVSAFSTHVVERLNAARRPAIYVEREYIDAGGLASYGADFNDMFRRLAGYVDRILRGAKPADMPIERPERIVLIVNLKTARMLGLAIPGAVLARADEVIE